VNEFAINLMPPDREGTYSTLVGIYMILPRFVADAFGGWLLSAYCPADGARHCAVMWSVIAIMNNVTWVLLWVCARYLRAGLPDELRSVAGVDGEDDTDATELGRFTIDNDDATSEAAYRDMLLRYTQERAARGLPVAEGEDVRHEIDDMLMRHPDKK